MLPPASCASSTSPRGESFGGRVLGEEEKAVENVYIRLGFLLLVLEHERSHCNQNMVLECRSWKPQCLQEIEILRKLKHENIIDMIDAFETPQEFFVFTEFAQGELFEVLEDDKILPEEQVQSIAA